MGHKVAWSNGRVISYGCKRRTAGLTQQFMQQHPSCTPARPLPSSPRAVASVPVAPRRIPRFLTFHPCAPRPWPQVLRPLSAYTCPLLTEADPRVMPAARALAAAALRFEHANRRR